MQVLQALSLSILLGVAHAGPAVQRRESARKTCLGEALARAKPLADAESYYVTICFIGRSTIDLNDSSMERWEPWYKHLSTVTCEGAKADCFALGSNNIWIGSAPPGPDNITIAYNVPGKCTYSYVVWHEVACKV